MNCELLGDSRIEKTSNLRQKELPTNEGIGCLVTTAKTATRVTLGGGPVHRVYEIMDDLGYSLEPSTTLSYNHKEVTTPPQRVFLREAVAAKENVVSILKDVVVVSCDDKSPQSGEALVNHINAVIDLHNNLKAQNETAST